MKPANDKPTCGESDEDFMPNDMTRWSIAVSMGAAIAVRTFLAQCGINRGVLSKLVEDAVKWRALDQTIAEARGKFADLEPEALESLIDEAVLATRRAHTPQPG